MSIKETEIKIGGFSILKYLTNKPFKRIEQSIALITIRLGSMRKTYDRFGRNTGSSVGGPRGRDSEIGSSGSSRAY